MVLQAVFSPHRSENAAGPAPNPIIVHPDVRRMLMIQNISCHPKSAPLRCRCGLACLIDEAHQPSRRRQARRRQRFFVQNC